MGKGPETIRAAAIEGHLRVLTERIGIRLAGSEGEQQAATYIANEFAEAGALACEEPFPVFERAVESEDLEVCVEGAWRSYPCSLFSSTPGTRGEWLQAPLAFFDAPTDYQLPSLEHLRGKAVVHLGCHIESRECYRRLLAAEPLFLLFVDVRYPGTVPLADGMFPSYVRDIGARPTLNVAYMDAWEWKRRGADAARVRIVAERRPSTSQNVVADLPGNDAEAGTIYCGAHHDTQAGTVGADDNASGVVTLLELARVLAPLPRKRTIRLISFGAEEQLSVGSAHYVRVHRDTVAQEGRFLFNFDSCGSLMGWNLLNGNGPEAMFDGIRAAFAAHGLTLNIGTEIIPYTDQFPFAVAGVPGVWFGRANCTAGRFFHHRSDETMERLSCELLARNAQAVADVLAGLAAADPFPFPRTIPEHQRAGLEAFWEDLYGGWRGL
ncbi:MAG: Zn-dependent exopeptidase M28 [Lentisphaeria bacterium]|nr:Zn-dependent exopeptidase M28 [Lentisphaeria bacterium]